ncbi:hypothetical protein SCG7109_AG_00270 [Chlamydiales bacterium SCGC AG-110-M15]|nr:hypothetical protein SCG7109_AG_00270 [Chlamydiales bacterium SCGC AG-110-M15]
MESKERDKRTPEIVSRHKTETLRLLPSDPDLVRWAPFHEVPGEKTEMKQNNNK